MSKYCSAKKMCKLLGIYNELFHVLLSEKEILVADMEGFNLGISTKSIDDGHIKFNKCHKIVFNKESVRYFMGEFGITD
jgi:hypothetical protein